MLEIRWHSRAGQGAVTGAKGLASVVAETGKQVQAIGKAIPNTPMLGAFMKVSGMFELEYFKEAMKGVLKKLPQNLIDANMIAIQRAYDEVH